MVHPEVCSRVGLATTVHPHCADYKLSEQPEIDKGRIYPSTCVCAVELLRLRHPDLLCVCFSPAKAFLGCRGSNP